MDEHSLWPAIGKSKNLCFGQRPTTSADWYSWRTPHWRSGIRHRLFEAAWIYGRKVYSESVQSTTGRSDVQNGRPGTLPARRKPRVAGPHGLSGEDTRLPC